MLPTVVNFILQMRKQMAGEKNLLNDKVNKFDFIQLNV